MAVQKSNSLGTLNYRGGALREDLAGFISNISRDERPFLTTLGTTKATLKRHEWQTDVLDSPAFNAQPEGFDFNTDNAEDVSTTRMSNYTTILGKTIHVSGTLIKSDMAGAQNAYVYTKKKRDRELMRDYEAMALGYDSFTTTNNARYVYDSTETTSFGGAFAYAAQWLRAAATTVESNDSAGTGTAITTVQGEAFNVAPATTTGQFVVQYTANPTLVPLTTDHIESLMQGFFDNGGKPSVAMAPSGLKSTVSNILIAGNAGAAQRRAEAMSRKVNLAVDMVTTEFGFSLSIIPNDIMQNFNSLSATPSGADDTILFYDPAMIKRAVLTPMTEEVDGTARYGRGSIMYCEETLEFKNPNSVGVIIGVS